MKVDLLSKPLLCMDIHIVGHTHHLWNGGKLVMNKLTAMMEMRNAHLYYQFLNNIVHPLRCSVAYLLFSVVFFNIFCRNLSSSVVT